MVDPESTILFLKESDLDGACESKPKGVQTQRRRVFRKQNPLTAGPKRDGGRWGVVPASEHLEILLALASLIRAQRYEMALTILDDEITFKQADSAFSPSRQALDLTTSQGQ